MTEIRKIELLSPAKDLKTGISAINNGADAVYIGAAHFGARQAAGNSVEDIGELVKYAHIFGVKIYVTLNTIIEETQIPEVEVLIAELYKVGVDALIIQDPGILRMNIPPIALHASTQMDNRDAAKVKFLSDTGFPRVVLARELSLKEIEEIHNSVPEVELEAFVHGALCVSYSGQCYASQHCYGRSANKGACAQFCRLAFDLVDADGKVIKKDKHLLSLKDMNRSACLEQMMDAGITSFKIEGRLKDESYVKNITAYYRACIDEILLHRKEYERASYGRISPHFVPQPEKSFNRGFTDYFLHGKSDGITSFDTPKSIGEYMGCVRVVARNFFTITGNKEFHNGDGACFIGEDGKLHGFRINRAEGGRIFPHTMPPLFQGAELYRNYDCEFERVISRPDKQRQISLKLKLSETDTGFRLSATDETAISAAIEFSAEKQVARTPQHENIISQLSKWGNTPFYVESVDIEFTNEWFIPSSMLSDIRRRLSDNIIEQHGKKKNRQERKPNNNAHKYPVETLDYRGNVANSLAVDFYKSHGVRSIAKAFECEPVTGVPIMYSKHCIKYAMGWCSKSGEKSPYREPYFLVSGDGKRFRLHFNCNVCQMHVYAFDGDE